MGAALERPDWLEEWLTPFRILFTQPTWQRLLVLAAGAILTTHRRTVTAALRVTGRGEDKGFSRYHDVLSRSRWSALAAARLLLMRLVATFVPAGPVVIGLDDTIERRWGAKIAARGIYRDPVRSSHGHFVKASGLRWLSAMLLVPMPWARRVVERTLAWLNRCRRLVKDWEASIASSKAWMVVSSIRRMTRRIAKLEL